MKKIIAFFSKIKHSSLALCALMLTILVILASHVNAQSTTRSAGAGAVSNSASGTVNFTNPGYVIANDAQWATAALPGSGYSHYLKATGFGFSIPVGDVIQGISVDIIRQSTGGAGIRDVEIKLIDASGNIVGNNNAVTGTNWPSSGVDGTATYGSSSDMWGTTFTRTDINSANFGVAIYVRNNNAAARNALVNYVRVTVYHAAPSYCTPAPTSVDNNGITNVTYGTITTVNNTTGKEGPPCYGNYSASSADVMQGGSFPMNITFSTGYTYAYKVWIDWNNDYDFADANEMCMSGTSAATNPTTVSGTISVPAGASLGTHRMRIAGRDDETTGFTDNNSTTTGYCYTGSYASFEDYSVNVVAPSPMSYTSSTTTQTVTEAVTQGSTSQQIIGIQIVTSGVTSPLTASSFTFNISGSNAAADITNAKLWTTGTSSTFATTTQLGATATTLTPNFTITGGTNMPYTLGTGTNYFWLTYDIAAGATLTDTVDAICTSITVGGSARTPTIQDPGPGRPILMIYTMSNTPVTTCSGRFTDSGGLLGNYAISENFTKVFTAGDGTHLRMQFINFTTDATWDYLKIYDGPNNTYPQVCFLDGNDIAPLIVSTGTQLTCVFVSDGFGTRAGWSADISCIDIPACGGGLAPGNTCATATTVATLNGYCASTSSYTADSPGNIGAVFCGSIENNGWLKFTADSSYVELDFIVSNPSGGNNGIQMAILETADCNTFTVKSTCWNPAMHVSGGITASGLTVGNTYYLMVDGYAGSGADYRIGARANTIVLPIELAAFNVICNQGKPTLTWTTASEINNDYFTIERSSDMKEWEKVTTIQGAGNSNVSLHYEYTDNFTTSTENFYRLKQTDFDGKYTYSEITFANCKKELEFSISNVINNTQTSELIVDMNIPNGKTCTMLLVSTEGKIFTNMVCTGENTESQTIRIPTSNIPKGLYTLILTDNTGNLLNNKVVLY